MCALISNQLDLVKDNFSYDWIHNRRKNMSNIILKVTTNQMSKMKEAYRPFLVQKPIPYTHFSAKKMAQRSLPILPGKVMFQGTGAEQEAAKWGNPLTAKKSTQTNSSSYPKDLQTLSVLGSDEVGNGSYFGPLTVYCYCLCRSNTIERITHVRRQRFKRIKRWTNHSN